MRLKLKLTITSLTLLFCHPTFGQVSDSLVSTPSELYGTWYLAHRYNGYHDSLPFLRSTKAPRNYGQRIEIKEDNQFIDSYTAPCGNDDALHHTIGKWTYDSKTKIFETTIVICFKDKTYRIATLTNDTLVLVKP